MKKKRKKKRVVVTPLIPEKPTANLTSAMRNELNATPEVFENSSSPHSSSPCSSDSAKETKSPEKKTPKKRARKRNVIITHEDDVKTFDADVIGTFSQSTGTISYDSIRSLDDISLEAIKKEGKYAENKEQDMQKVIEQQLSQGGATLPEIRIISDAELDRRITGRETPFDSQEAVPATPIWGHCETILTKKCIDEVVENFFASPRDDIELTMRLSRRDMYPRLHIELAPIYDDLHTEASYRSLRPVATPFAFRNRRGRFDDLLRTGGLDEYLPSTDPSMQSMEERSASMCHTTYSDLTTARPPSHDYFTSAYSYLVALVKSVVSSRSQTSTATTQHEG